MTKKTKSRIKKAVPSDKKAEFGKNPTLILHQIHLANLKLSIQKDGSGN